MNFKLKIKNEKNAARVWRLFHFSFFIFHLSLRAAQYQVSSPAEIADAAAHARPGDTLVMRDGVWPDVDLLFSADGTPGQPITLRAQTLGAVHLTGQSRLRLSGSYLVVD